MRIDHPQIATADSEIEVNGTYQYTEYNTKREATTTASVKVLRLEPNADMRGARLFIRIEKSNTDSLPKGLEFHISTSGHRVENNLYWKLN